MLFELYFGFFVPFSGTEWYFKLPLTVPLSPTEIQLNGPKVLNDTEWYSMVFSSIPLTLFGKGYLYISPHLSTFVFNVSAPTALAHTVREPVTLRGYHLPKDTFVHVNIYQSHMDPKTWKDPFAFNPDRWLDETNTLKNNPAFMPFGVGKIWSTAKFEFANVYAVCY